MLTDGEKGKFVETYIDTFLLQSDQVNLEKMKSEAVTEFDDLYPQDQSTINEHRWRKFKVSAANPKDYEERLIDLPSGKAVLVGIRHYGGNTKIPFISIWPNFPILDVKELSLIYENCKNFYQVFNPLYLQVWCKPDSSIYAELSKIAISKRCHMLGVISEILEDKKDRVFPRGYSLTEIRNTDFYEWYCKLYEELKLHQPGISQIIGHPNDKEDMEHSMSEGLLWAVQENQNNGSDSGLYRQFFEAD